MSVEPPNSDTYQARWQPIAVANVDTQTPKPAPVTSPARDICDLCFLLAALAATLWAPRQVFGIVLGCWAVARVALLVRSYWRRRPKTS